MKKNGFIIILLLAFFVVCFPIVNLKTASFNIVNAETKNVKISFFNAPPHIYQDEKTGQMKGAFYELLENYIAPKMNVKFIWDANPLVVPRQLEQLATEKEDAAALLVYTPERAQKVIFPQAPYVSVKSALALLKSHKLDNITKEEDIAGMTVGYAAGSFISPFMKNDKIKFDLVSAPNFNEINFKKMQNKRIDAVYAPDKAGLMYIVKQLNLDQDCKVLDLPEKPTDYNIVFCQSRKDLAASYNKAFQELNGTQLYLKLLGKYLDTSKL